MESLNVYPFIRLGHLIGCGDICGALLGCVLGGLLGLGGLACADIQAGGEDTKLASTQQALSQKESGEQAQWNDLATTFYDPSNVLQIDITMDPNAWEELKAEVPKGETCNAEYIGDRYDWYDAREVQVRGTAYGSAPVVLSSAVQLKKRGWCSSWNTGRPSLKIKFRESGTDAVRAKIGTRYLALNNNWSPDMPPPYPFQDPYFLRTCLGYRLFKEAGLPYSRCNFAIVRVNGEAMPWGPYINVEPIEELY